MLKGKMKIELTDVHTGETETVLEQNMVTNALANIFKPMGLDKSPGKMLNGMNPYYQTLLGGLLLFDAEIEENADNLYPPSGVNLIGCASYGVQNNTTGTLRGGATPFFRFVSIFCPPFPFRYNECFCVYQIGYGGILSAHH